MTNRIWRKITNYSERPSSDGYILTIKLECGHTVYRKSSQGLPKKGKLACKECEILVNRG